MHTVTHFQQLQCAWLVWLLVGLPLFLWLEILTFSSRSVTLQRFHCHCVSQIITRPWYFLIGLCYDCVLLISYSSWAIMNLQTLQLLILSQFSWYIGYNVKPSIILNYLGYSRVVDQSDNLTLDSNELWSPINMNTSSTD